MGQFATRLDIVADHYYPFSIKSPTRQDRGTGGSRLLFREDTPFPSDFSTDFLKNSENKEDLNMFLASAARHKSWEKLVYVTHGEGVKECTTGGDIRMYEDDGLTLEEADNRMICHISHMIDSGMSRIAVRTADTDVIFILLGFMSQFYNNDNRIKIFCDFGTGDHREVIPIHSMHQRLGEEICLGILFFHAFTGCDSTSSFFEMTKKKWFERWLSCPMSDKVTTAFQQLSWLPSEETIMRNLDTIKEFISFVYIYRGKGKFKYCQTDNAHVLR